MPITQPQLDQIKKLAKAKGYSDEQIASSVAAMMKQYQGNQLNEQAGSQISTAGVSVGAAQSTAQPNQSMNTQPEAGFVSSFFKSMYTAVTDPLRKSAGFGTDIVLKNEALGGGEEMRKQNPFLNEDEISQLDTAGGAAKQQVKNIAGIGAVVVPGGSTVKGAMAAGAASGALFGLSEGEDFDVNKVISGAAGGAVGGAVMGVAGKVLSGAGRSISNTSNYFKKKGVDLFSDSAAENITKASPSMWEKAVTEHGFDLNNLTRKYFKSGADYDTMLGPISKKGRGGLLASEIKNAEAVIEKEMRSSGANTKFTIKEITDALELERKQIMKLPGNEQNAAALSEFIAGFNKQYGKGITPARLLELKRVADSKFGKAVADENTGSAIAQAQKMVANAARAKLKKLLPKVKSSLDTQSEVYTLQPILSRARAIDNTRGSTIRAGKIQNVSLLNPLSWATIPEVVLADPQRASKLLNYSASQGGENLLERAGRGVTGLAEQTSSAGSIVGANLALGGEKSIDTPQDNSDNLSNEDKSQNVDGKINQDSAPINKNNNTIIPQAEEAKPFGGRSKVELLQLAIARGATKKDLEEISGMYDMAFGDQESEADKLDGLLNKRKTLSEAGFSTDSIDSQIELLGFKRVGTTGSTQDLTTQINNISTVGERNGARAVKDILDVVDSAITKAKGTPTGPLSSAEASLSKLGNPNETAKLQKDLSEILRTIRKESTGVAFSPQEIKALEEEIPSIMQQEGNVNDSLIRLKQRMLQKLTNFGVDVSSELSNQ